MNDHPIQNDHNTPTESVATPTTAAEEQALEVFGQWMDSELEKLVARWIHLAAPNAQRPSRRSFRPHAK